MVKFYSRTVPEDQKSARASGNGLRTHFKNAREVGHAIKGMELQKAKAYLDDVLEMKQAIPYKRFTGGRGRHSQGKNVHAPGSQCGWPVKSVQYFRDLLVNAEANANSNQMSGESMYIWHVQVNQAPKHRRRTYRAHGRIGAYKASPCHIEIILRQKFEGVKKAVRPLGKVSTKKASSMRHRKHMAAPLVEVGGGLDEDDE